MAPKDVVDLLMRFNLNLPLPQLELKKGFITASQSQLVMEFAAPSTLRLHDAKVREWLD